MSYLQKLKTDGDLVLWHDYRSGSLIDLSGTGNDGTIANEPTFSKVGLNFDGVDDHVTVAGDSTLQFGDGSTDSAFSIIWYGKAINDTESELFISNCESQSVTQQMYSCWVDAAEHFHLRLYDASESSYLDHFAEDAFVRPYLDAPIFLVATYDGSGIVTGIKHYVNGLYVSTTGDASSGAYTAMEPLDKLAGVGRWATTYSPFNTGVVAIANKELDSTEVAKIYADVLATQWPNKSVDKTTMSEVSYPNDSSCVGYWNMKPINDSIIDYSGYANDGTKYGQPVFAGSNIGNYAYLDASNNDYFDCGNPAGGELDFGTGDFTIAYWMRTSTLAASDIISKRNGVTTTPGFILGLSGATGAVFMEIDDGVGNEVNRSGTTDLTDGVWHYVVFAFDRSGDATIYVDGQSEGTQDISAVGSVDNAISFLIGRNGNGTREYTGDVAHVQAYNELKDATWAQLEYEKVAKLVRAKTDWGSKEAGIVTSGYIGGTPWQVSTGSYKIEADTVNGKDVKVLKNATAGLVYIDTSSLGMDSASAAYGTWEFWVFKGADGNAMFIQFMADVLGNITAAGQDGYNFKIDANEKVLLQESTNGVSSTLMSSTNGYVNYGEWMKIKIQRRYDGQFSVYINNILVDTTGGSGTNPVTDNTTTASNYIIFDLDAGDMVSLGSITGDEAFTKYLGVI